MAGHSKWNNIKRTKGVVDQKRASTFTRLSKDISNAVKIGEGGDIGFNPLLKVAVDRAKASNMPNDNIQKAIDKGLGKVGDGVEITENTYEFYGPNGTTFIVDCETDNANRTVGDLKIIASKNNLKFASMSSISWQYKEVGEIVLEINPALDEDEVTMQILDLNGIVDVKRAEDSIVVVTEKVLLKQVVESIRSMELTKSMNILSAGIVKKAEDIMDLDTTELNPIIDALEECSDVVNIWTNFKL